MIRCGTVCAECDSAEQRLDCRKDTELLSKESDEAEANGDCSCTRAIDVIIAKRRMM